MGIIQWIKKFLKKEEVKQLGSGTKVNERLKFKEKLLHDTNSKDIVDKIAIREKQIISIKNRVLYEDDLTKENICEQLEEPNLLNDVEKHALINIYNILREQEYRGEVNIYYAIKENNDNYLRLVNKMRQEIKWKSLFSKDLKSLSEDDVKRIVEEIVNGQSLEEEL